MAEWIAQHAVALMVFWYFFSAIVSGMPPPDGQSGVGYLWAYQSLHVLSGDLSQFLRRRIHEEGGPSHGE